MMQATNDRPLPEATLAQLSAYRERLLQAGFREAAMAPLRFYRPDTEWTAFAVNLQGDASGVTVVYGYASTAFTRMAGDEQALQQYGCSENILCESLRIAHGESSAPAEASIRVLYNAHHGIEKDELLALVQAKRKAFIQTIAMRLKPLGFRKVRNNWTYTRDDGYQVLFVLQKSMYSDGYYFNLNMHPTGKTYPYQCYSARILLEDEECLPWQALGEAAMAAFLDDMLLPAVRRLVFSPLNELGRDPLIWQKCCCRRDLCERCWMEKNVWEARGLPVP